MRYFNYRAEAGARWYIGNRDEEIDVLGHTFSLERLLADDGFDMAILAE